MLYGEPSSDDLRDTANRRHCAVLYIFHEKVLHKGDRTTVKSVISTPLTSSPCSSSFGATSPWRTDASSELSPLRTSVPRWRITYHCVIRAEPSDPKFKPSKKCSTSLVSIYRQYEMISCCSAISACADCTSLSVLSAVQQKNTWFLTI